MLETKIVDYDEMYEVDYNFNQCRQKDEIMEILNSSTPVEVKTVNTKGSSWNFDKDFNIHCYSFIINNGKIFISNMTENVSELYNFLENVAYYDDKELLCSIHDEGAHQGISVIPVGDNRIRFTIFDYQYIYNKKILSDIIVDKYELLSAFRNVTAKIYKSMQKKDFAYKEYQIKKIEKGLNILDEYCKSPEKYKKEHEVPVHLRLFTVAYKKPDCDWEFGIYIEGDKQCEIEYWEKEKQEGRILKYDLEEDYPVIKGEEPEITDPSYRDSENKRAYDMATNKMINVNRTKSVNMETRVKGKNWCYSTETQKWYSTDEEMPEPKLGWFCIQGNMHCYIDIKENYDNEDAQIRSYIRDCDENGEGWLDCVLEIKDRSRDDGYKLDFNYRYRNLILEGLENVKEGKYARISIDESCPKLHIWRHKDDNLGLAYTIPQWEGFQNDRIEWHISCVKKDIFVNDILNGLKKIEHKIEVMKNVIKSGKELNLDEKFKFKETDNFIGDYSCVRTNLRGCGIINKDGLWANKADEVVIYGKTHPHFGRELKGFIYKYYWLDGIDGKYFIAAKQDNKKFVMDVNGDIQLPYVVDNIYWTKVDGENRFIFQDDNKSWITDETGKKLLELDFTVGEKFYLFDDIFICTKDDKFGIVAVKGKNKGKVLIDFIFNDIKPPKADTEYIAVCYIDKWGYVNRKGKILNVKAEK